MNETFEKFLKKNTHQANWRQYPNWGCQKMISIEALGEWAWKEFKENYKEQCIKHRFFVSSWLGSESSKEYLEDSYKYCAEEHLFMGIVNTMKEIALACLGKKEIEKRLKELK